MSGYEWQGMAKGAAAGGTAGSSAGPYGAAAGAVAGAVLTTPWAQGEQDPATGKSAIELVLNPAARGGMSLEAAYRELFYERPDLAWRNDLLVASGNRVKPAGANVSWSVEPNACWVDGGPWQWWTLPDWCAVGLPALVAWRADNAATRPGSGGSSGSGASSGGYGAPTLEGDKAPALVFAPYFPTHTSNEGGKLDQKRLDQVEPSTGRTIAIAAVILGATAGSAYAIHRGLKRTRRRRGTR